MPESDKLPEELTQEKVLKGWRESVNTIPEEYTNKQPADGEITARIVKENKDYVNKLKNDYKLNDSQCASISALINKEAQDSNVYNTINNKVLEQLKEEKPEYNTIQNNVLNEFDKKVKEQTEKNIGNGIYPNKQDLIKAMKQAVQSTLEKAKVDYKLDNEKDKESIEKLKESLESRYKRLYPIQMQEYEKAKSIGKVEEQNLATDNSQENKSKKNIAQDAPSPDSSNYVYSSVSYSGCDMVVSAQISYDGDMHAGGNDVAILGSLQTISYSLYDKMSPIHALGNVNAKDYVHTHRTVAGSMDFAVFNKHWSKDIIKKYKEDKNIPKSQKVVIDEIPPLNLTISMANEFGASSRLALYGVRFFNEGMTMSVNDIYTENTFQFVALDVDYLDEVRSVNITSADIMFQKTRSEQQNKAEAPNNIQVKDVEDEDEEENENKKQKEKSPQEYAQNVFDETMKNNATKDNKELDYDKIKDEAIKKVEQDYKDKQEQLLKDYNEGNISRKEYHDGMTNAKEYFNSAKDHVKDNVQAAKKKQKDEKKKAAEQAKVDKQNKKDVISKFKECEELTKKYTSLIQKLTERKEYYAANNCKSGAKEMEAYISQANKKIDELNIICDNIKKANNGQRPSDGNVTENAVIAALSIDIDSKKNEHKAFNKECSDSIKDIDEITKKLNKKS